MPKIQTLSVSSYILWVLGRKIMEIYRLRLPILWKASFIKITKSMVSVFLNIKLCLSIKVILFLNRYHAVVEVVVCDMDEIYFCYNSQYSFS